MNKTKNAERSERRLQMLLFMILTVLVLLAVWFVGEVVSTPAIAQTGGAVDGFGGMSGRITQLLEAQQQTNEKLDRLITLLSTGEAKVQLVAEGDPDEKTR